MGDEQCGHLLYIVMSICDAAIGILHLYRTIRQPQLCASRTVGNFTMGCKPFRVLPGCEPGKPKVPAWSRAGGRGEMDTSGGLVTCMTR